MNASSVNAIQAVWLDPFSPLGEAERAQLDAAGICLQTVATFGDMQVALRRAHVLIIRLGDRADLLAEVQTLIGQLGFTVPVICRVERRRMEVAVAAMRLGAEHVLASDEWDAEVWASAVAPLRTSVKAPKSFVFVDPVSQNLLALAQRVAQTDVTALLVGPTGAGKEVLARVLHESSPRAKGPFVALNCAALPEHLIEDMLFGHEKGAFTGAHKDHKGLFEQAQGGTVFLDEIGEMPIQLQAKLLRVLQEKKLNRLGGEAVIDLDIRLVAATNKDLRAAIEAREFREDLYFRISTFRLRIQPLRERVGDILPLVAQSLARHAQGGVPLSITPESQQLLTNYPWPGNVRELENVVQRAVVLCSGRSITPAHLMFDEGGHADYGSHMQGLLANDHQPSLDMSVANAVVGHGNPTTPTHPLAQPALWEGFATHHTAPSMFSAVGTAADNDLQNAVKHSEHQMIMAAIQTTESREAAARKLGISPRTLRYKLAQLRERGMNLAFAD